VGVVDGTNCDVPTHSLHARQIQFNQVTWPHSQTTVSEPSLSTGCLSGL